LKRFVHGYDSEDKLTSIITGHLLPSESRPELPGTTSLTPPCPALTAASGGNPYVNGSSIVRPLRLSHRSNFHGRMQILPSGNPSKSWAALLDFFHALQGNVTNWIRKMERNGMTTLAAHGEDLFGSEGAKATIRAELRLDLKLNKDAGKDLSG